MTLKEAPESGGGPLMEEKDGRTKFVVSVAPWPPSIVLLTCAVDLKLCKGSLQRIDPSSEH